MSKVGRNDPCPCGSQNKYKRCCLEQDQQNGVIRVAFPQQGAASATSSSLSAETVGPHDALLSIIELEMDWSDDKYKGIAKRLVDNLVHEYGLQETLVAIDLWNRYSNQNQPIIRKEEVCLAAIEYCMAEAQGAVSVTQVSLAKKYGVSAAAISQRVSMIFEETDVDEDGLPTLEEHLLVEQALQMDPDTPDRYNMLAEVVASDLKEAILYYKQGMQAGEHSLGANFFAKNRGHFWGLVETRPYMRSKFGYADCLWADGKTKQAAREFEELLSLNPHDNQGARFPLLAAYFELRLYHKAADLMNQYREEHNASYVYNQVLLEYGQNGLSDFLASLFKEARKANRYVLDYLLGKKKLPDEMPDYCPPGSPDEAITYVQVYNDIWHQEPRLIQWMQKQIP
jgi:hypothetical protein